MKSKNTDAFSHGDKENKLLKNLCASRQNKEDHLLSVGGWSYGPTKLLRNQHKTHESKKLTKLVATKQNIDYKNKLSDLIQKTRNFNTHSPKSENMGLKNEKLSFPFMGWSSVAVGFEETKPTDKNPHPQSQSKSNVLSSVIEDDTTYLDDNGLPKVGTWVEEGDIMVGKVRHEAAYRSGL